VACEVTLNIRLRNSRSKPFMTDRTTISVATPSANPSTDIRATNDTNPRRCVERRYLVPIIHSYGAACTELLVTEGFGRTSARGADCRV